MPTSGELKTKPSQHSVNVLRSYGIQPEILVCRTTKPIPKTEKEKLALFCSVPKDAVIECRDMKSIYEVPLALNNLPREAAIIPFPKELTTPPVIKIYFVILTPSELLHQLQIKNLTLAKTARVI